MRQPLRVKFSKLCSASFNRDTDRRVVFKFCEMWQTLKSCVAYLTKNTKFRLALQLSPLCGDRAQNLPGPAPGNLVLRVLQITRFHTNRFTFGGVIAERVNTAKMHRKLNPIFG